MAFRQRRGVVGEIVHRIIGSDQKLRPAFEIVDPGVVRRLRRNVARVDHAVAERCGQSRKRLISVVIGAVRACPRGPLAFRENTLPVNDDKPFILCDHDSSFPFVTRIRSDFRSRQIGFLLGDVAALEQQRSDETDDQRDDHTKVGRGPTAALTADEEQQIALPVQPIGGGVDHQTPAEHGTDDENGEGFAVPNTVASLRIVEVGGAVVLFANDHIGHEHAGPDGHRHAKRGQDALERADERVGEEGHIDHAEHSQGRGERSGHGARQLDAEGEQCESVGIVVHDGTGHQAEHDHDGVWDQVPGRQNGRYGANRIITDVFGHVGIGDGQQQTIEDEEHVGDGRAERRPEHDAAVGGFARQIPRVIGRDIHPAQAEAGHHKEAAAKHGGQ